MESSLLAFLFNRELRNKRVNIIVPLHQICTATFDFVPEVQQN